MRLLLVSLMAGSLLVLLIRLPADLMALEFAAERLFLRAPEAGIAPETAQMLAENASLAYGLGGAMALLVLFVGGLAALGRRAESRAQAMTPGRPRTEGKNGGARWRPRINPYAQKLETPAAPRKIAEAHPRRAPKAVISPRSVAYGGSGRAKPGRGGRVRPAF